MPSWDTYKTEAKSRGALALELYVAWSEPAAGPEAVKAALADHLAYQARLEAEGALALAGPLSDLAGENVEGMGMIIYRAASLAAARKLAEADPMHASGARRFTLRRWLVNEGALTLSVGLSGRTVSLS